VGFKGAVSMQSKLTLLILAILLGPSTAKGGPVATHYRSIGVAPGALYASGKATIAGGEVLVTFQGASLPNPYATGAVGRGDKLIIGDETFFILSRVSPTQVVVESQAAVDHVDEKYIIERAYRSLQAWESDRGGNLVGENRREIGVVYNDGTFLAGLAIEGSRTDSAHYLHLTVEEGQRHDGMGSIGAVIEPAGDGDAVEIEDDYTRIDWLEIRHWKGTGSAGVRIAADRVSLSNLIVHDGADGADGASDAIRFTSASGAAESTLSNSILYRAPGAGVRVGDEGNVPLSVLVTNVSVFGCGFASAGAGGGIVLGPGVSVSATNVVAADNQPKDFHNPAGSNRSWTDSSHNVSSDSSAPGPDSMMEIAAESLFQSPSAEVDNFHLRADSLARNSGTRLAPASSLDVDGEARSAVDWDRGADEVVGTGGNDLLYLGARPWHGPVVVQWVTRNETPGLRFRLSRSRSSEGPWKAVSPRAIESLVASTGNTSYFYVDEEASRGSYYLLELQTADARATAYGPIAPGGFAGAEIHAATPAELERLDLSARTTIVYGVPGSTAWRVLQRDEHHVDLELTVGGFEGTVSDDGIFLRVQEGEDRLRQGSFSIPVFRTWLEGLPSGEVTLELVRSQNMVSFSPSTSLSGSDADGPASLPLARVLKVEPRGGQSKALVELAPLRWNGRNETLSLSRRLILRFTLGTASGRRPSASGGSREAAPRPNRR
jgi:hypothetical protein